MKGLEQKEEIYFKKNKKRVKVMKKILFYLIPLMFSMGSGCAVGPDFKSPEISTPSTYSETRLPEKTASSPINGGASQSFDFTRDLSAQWWTLFHSPELNSLIEKAIKESPTLAAAESALKGAQEDLRAIKGGLLYPALDGNLQMSRQQTSGNTGTGPSNLFTLYNASVGVSYTLDIFGGSRRQIEVFKAKVDYQRYQYEAAYLSLTSNIVTTAIREAMQRAQIASTKDMIAAEEKQLELVNNQFILGAGLKTSVLFQQSELSSTKASLPQLEKQISITRHALAALTGQFPTDARLPEFKLESLTLPQGLPVSLPSSLARQRPDIQASESVLHQACAAVGVATANLYPQITIGAGYGTQAIGTDLLFAGQSTVWNIGAGLLQPLFHGGQLTARKRSAVAAYEQAASIYKQTVLNAFSNVADVLHSLETDARSLQYYHEAEAAAKETLYLTNKQYELGAVNYLSLLIAQLGYNRAQMNMIQAQAQRYADTAALFNALGGGWWNRETAPVETAKAEKPDGENKKAEDQFKEN
jgi:NodT family efflux transporter outer membrane factor (OMF) lipoprotein